MVYLSHFLSRGNQPTMSHFEELKGELPAWWDLIMKIPDLLTTVEDPDEEVHLPDLVTVGRVQRFLATNALIHYRASKKNPPLPNVWCGTNGSADLFWESSGLKCLATVPASGDITYAGHTACHTEVRGAASTHDDSASLLFSWLTEMLS